MTLSEMTTFANTHSPFGSKISIRVSLATPKIIKKHDMDNTSNMCIRFYCRNVDFQNPGRYYTSITTLDIYVTKAMFFIDDYSIQGIICHELGHLNSLMYFHRKSDYLGRHYEHIADMNALLSGYCIRKYAVARRKLYDGSVLKFWNRRIKYMSSFKKLNLSSYNSYPLCRLS